MKGRGMRSEEVLRGLSARVRRGRIMLCFFSCLLVLVGFWVGLECPRIYTDAHGFCLGGFGV
jgi:hypothetical protein